ncbi:DNA-binding MurR/RpiR family transcriptional regulator [Planomicrobium koreense]|uniref:DNA-binding MurR/RpiR family transcriptional regulator n=1 Tax=Planococcus koreensis TaxID=112331 RepID=A0A7W8FSV1_9BACL|nr:MurR/RpiR family transcriptional regulator [Planococcus koreensis]MBB5180368.1 DNA-binding MurR/RpiR family transcriptional regulator [Planococcus koreensis]
MKEQQFALAAIRGSYQRFSDKEKKIADYVLNDPKNIIHLTINQIADELGLAESTIFRFCQRIGFKGFQAFKISLAAEVVAPLKDIHEQIEEGDSVRSVTEKVFRSNINTLEETLQIVDAAAMERAVQAIMKARKTEFFGSGGSAMIAMDGYHKFIRLGLLVSMNLDSHMQLMAASQLQKGDVAIVISHSGSTTDVLDILRVLKEKDVTIICVTNFAKSPLSKDADIALYTISEETDFRSEALSSRIAQLSLIDALYTNLMIARGDEGKSALQDMREAISQKRL